MTDWKPIDEACSRVLRWKNGKPFEGDRKEMWVEFNSYAILNENPYKTMLYGKLEEIANEQQAKLDLVREIVNTESNPNHKNYGRGSQHLSTLLLEVLGNE